MFCCPYVFEYSEFFPIAVFLKPEVLDLRASSPTAVLFDPLVLANSASSPIATLSSPLVILGIPVTAPSSEKEYKERLPAKDAFPAKITPHIIEQALFSFKNI